MQIEMAHKVLSSDMAQLIDAMKLAQHYSTTLLDNEYRRGMLKAAHVLAMDSKNLLDSVDNARRQTDCVEPVESSQVAGPQNGHSARPAVPCRTSSRSSDLSQNSSAERPEWASAASGGLSSDEEGLRRDFAATVTLSPSLSPSPEPDSSGTHNSREDTYSRVFEESLNQEGESSPVTDEDSNC